MGILSPPYVYITLTVVLVLGLGLGYWLRRVVSKRRLASAEETAERLVQNAKNEAKTIVKEAKLEAKDEALFWVYVIEWFTVSGTGMMCGAILWTLMVRRAAYREVGTTRFDGSR